MGRDFMIDQKPDEVLRLMEAGMSGNENYLIIGSAWLTYKAGELNSKATERLVKATHILAITSSILAITSICQLIALVYNIIHIAHT
jgi:hypothetical protein